MPSILRTGPKGTSVDLQWILLQFSVNRRREADRKNTSGTQGCSSDDIYSILITVWDESCRDFVTTLGISKKTVLSAVQHVGGFGFNPCLCGVCISSLSGFSNFLPQPNDTGSTGDYKSPTGVYVSACALFVSMLALWDPCCILYLRKTAKSCVIQSEYWHFTAWVSSMKLQPKKSYSSPTRRAIINIMLHINRKKKQRKVAQPTIRSVEAAISISSFFSFTPRGQITMNMLAQASNVENLWSLASQRSSRSQSCQHHGQEISHSGPRVQVWTRAADKIG